MSLVGATASSTLRRDYGSRLGAASFGGSSGPSALGGDALGRWRRLQNQGWSSGIAKILPPALQRVPRGRVHEMLDAADPRRRGERSGSGPMIAQPQARPVGDRPRRRRRRRRRPGGDEIGRPSRQSAACKTDWRGWPATLLADMDRLLWPIAGPHRKAHGAGGRWRPASSAPPPTTSTSGNDNAAGLKGCPMTAAPGRWAAEDRCRLLISRPEELEAMTDFPSASTEIELAETGSTLGILAPSGTAFLGRKSAPCHGRESGVRGRRRDGSGEAPRGEAQPGSATGQA